MRHKRATLVPLTEEERKFASENHYIVDKFLQYSQLPRCEWYDVVIFRYLLSVKNWFERPDLHQWKFTTIAQQGM